MFVIARVNALRPLRQLIQRRHRQVEMPAIDEPRHLPIKERDEQRSNVGAVDVGVCHDDYLVIAQIVVAVVQAGPATERLNEVGELLVRRELVAGGRGDVEDFAAQG
jgi:hypothetical protein